MPFSAKKHDLAPQGRLVCTAKGTCSGIRKALITQQTRLVFHVIHIDTDSTHRQSSTETAINQRITPNRPFSSKTFHDTVSCPAPPFSAIRNPHSKANIRQEKSRKTALSAPHTRLLEAQTRRKVGPTPKASVAFSCKGFGIAQSFSYFSIGYSKFFHNFAEIICTK